MGNLAGLSAPGWTTDWLSWALLVVVGRHLLLVAEGELLGHVTLSSSRPLPPPMPLKTFALLLTDVVRHAGRALCGGRGGQQSAENGLCPEMFARH